MIWGIKVEKYLEDGNKCKYYGDKACPCVSNKDIRKQYDKRCGYWAIGIPLDKLITHKYPLEQINEALETNLKMEGLKIAIVNE